MTDTDIRAEKLALIHEILEVEDKKILILIRRLLESALKSESGIPANDFWSELSEKQKNDILESIREIETGESIAHSHVMTELRQRFAK
ncbi:MAG: hypothetical protein JNJ90_16845 [Saprospiraceae bacterium]|jgi:hypothetical protein|nr:hypothetical protein [Saprospiraceae bacterium]